MQPRRFWAFSPRIPLIKDDNRIPCRPPQQDRLRHCQTERFGGREVDGHFEFDWHLNWQVPRRCPHPVTRATVMVYGHLTVGGTAESLCHQPKLRRWTAHGRARFVATLWTSAGSKRSHGRDAQQASAWIFAVRSAGSSERNGRQFPSLQPPRPLRREDDLPFARRTSR